MFRVALATLLVLATGCGGTLGELTKGLDRADTAVTHAESAVYYAVLDAIQRSHFMFEDNAKLRGDYVRPYMQVKNDLAESLGYLKNAYEAIGAENLEAAQGNVCAFLVTFKKVQDQCRKLGIPLNDDLLKHVGNLKVIVRC